MKKYYLFISIFCIIFDQLTKYIIKSLLALNSSVIIIKDFFNLTYVQNTGAAWSILSGNRLFFITIALISLFAIYYFFIYKKDLKWYEHLTYGFLLGGIIGNLIDRLLFGYVIDFFDFNILGYAFPIFNIADICIVVSVIFLIFDILVGDKNANN